ncbi:alpha/beta hydrolase [Labilibacter marinus]|uniref:alpha/beta hydrolase n=1 Tax=Labilibacter marinus TaxID=1477105 RepID=UPI00082C6D42|nr:alpha/beta hydrolase [Labilibacter marinus]
MKQLILLSLFITISCNFYAQVVPLWDKKDIPNYQKSKGKEEVPPRDILFIKNIQEPTVEVMLPSKQSANGMAVLICPGGGYGGVAYDWEGTDVGKYLNSKGISAFVLKYRMPQAESVVISHKAPLQDAQRAIRYIRHNAKKFNLDKNKIGVMGFSAGGHLASSLGTHFTEAYYEAKDDIDTEIIRPDFMMLFYPVISMKKGVTHNGSRNNLLGKNPSEDLVSEFSNELQVTEQTPPTFILHSGDDKAVPVENSIRMYQALLKNNVKATMHIYPTGGHGYGLGKSREAAPDWADLATEWFLTMNN